MYILHIVLYIYSTNTLQVMQMCLISNSLIKHNEKTWKPLKMQTEHPVSLYLSYMLYQSKICHAFTHRQRSLPFSANFIVIAQNAEYHGVYWAATATCSIRWLCQQRCCHAPSRGNAHAHSQLRQITQCNLFEAMPSPKSFRTFQRNAKKSTDIARLKSNWFQLQLSR